MTPDQTPSYEDLYQVMTCGGTCHGYLGTGCADGRRLNRPEMHQYCATTVQRAVDAGIKVAGTCKHCGAPCVCPCHEEAQAPPPMTWRLPDPPPPEVTRLRDRHDRRWVRDDDEVALWRRTGYGDVAYWPELLDVGPLTEDRDD